MLNPSIVAPSESAPDQRVQDAAYYRGVLHELIDMGTDLARMVHRQAQLQVEAGMIDGAEDVAVAGFERIARTIRRTILLAQKLDAPVRAPVRAPDRDLVAARRRIIRSVEDAIQRETDSADGEALHAEFLDRLDGPDLEDEIGDRPVGEIIADLCRDLGLGAPEGTHPWKRRSPADVAVLCARAAAVRAAAVTVAVGGLAQGMPGLRSQAGCRGP